MIYLFSPKEPKKFPFRFMFAGLWVSRYNIQFLLWFSRLEMINSDTITSLLSPCCQWRLSSVGQ